MSQSVISGVLFNCLDENVDSRGWLRELWRHDELSPEHLPMMGYISCTLPGIVRGAHEHLLQTDIFIFMGPAIFELYLWDRRGKAEVFEKHICEQYCRVIVPPGVVHGYKNISDSLGYVMNFPNKLYRGFGKLEPVDEIRYENDLNSLFKMN